MRRQCPSGEAKRAVLRALARLEEQGRELIAFHTIYCAVTRELGEPESRREHSRRCKLVERALTALEDGGQLQLDTFYLKHVWSVTEHGHELLAALDTPALLRPSVRTRLSGLAERVGRRVAIPADGVL